MHRLLNTAVSQPAAPPDPTADPYAEGYAAGRLDERAAIAAYLRTEANRRVEALERADRRLFVMAYASCHRWADAIERGGHIEDLATKPATPTLKD